MEDRSNEIFSQYDLKIYRAYRARGGMILETGQGLKFYGPCKGSARRLEFEDALKQQMKEHGYTRTDGYIRNKENNLISTNSLGEKYCIRDWYELEEGSLKKEEHILYAARNLAFLHLVMTDIRMPDNSAVFVEEDLNDCFEKRTKELKRVGTYLVKRRNKSAFEVKYLNCCKIFYEEAVKAGEQLAKIEVREFCEESILYGKVLHGSYTYHNVLMPRHLERSCLMTAEASGDGIATVNFEKAVFGMQVYDLYQYLRKVMEKNNWNWELGSRVLMAYEEIRALSTQERKLLHTLLLYPEKFWKITNYYYNSRKSLIPQKNAEKLDALLLQQKEKQEFLHRLCQF
ncbi:MAG: hypothetical protein IJY09_02425 [Lachnospiraceae bacterium]|nr:hypothetical protein [Lachnospiraceae bacterium]